MSNVGGTYDFVVNSPMGEQKGTMIVVPDDSGTSFTGSLNGSLGAMDINDGTISGNTLSWKMKMSMPLPMTLDCEATVDGDDVTGTIDAGMMGKMPLTAKRQQA
ncbi:hypothetical protein [Aurantiacibacter marinus]|uniref:Uncharacterized protein n=1 Tax=Aurantiacibacter marinus TaxID=874156 RepID=A0A0H0XQN2_9SPHN|nr:hypothetical protein [Aurantiacibacter marinus]KLI64262.1 hypothetical protein AAV99_01005 [Aurantiacibacter marinus]